MAGRIPSLDGLRAISISLVLFAHATGTHGAFWPNIGIFRGWGELGVRVFFVISGFLITTLLLREHATTGRVSLKAFYWRRTGRIFPAAYVFLAVLAAAGAFGLVTLNDHDVLTAATYTANYNFDRSWYVGHMWSLAVEEQFYLLWPAVIVLVSVRRALWVAAAVVALVPLVRLGLWTVFGADYGIGHTFETTADALAAGCLLAGCRDWLWTRGWYRRLLSPILLAPAAVALLLLAGPLGDRPRINALVGASAVTLVITLVIDWCLRNPGGRVGAALNWRPIVWVGTLSYSLYLWQQPFLHRGANAWWTAWPVNILLALGCATASYYLVERPALAWRDQAWTRLQSWRARRRVPEVTPVGG